MHPLRHPRNAALVGILFVVIGVIYYVVPAGEGLAATYDIAAGTTMLIFLGVAMAIMAYVLVAGSTDE
jgi:heme/copper-type cytochrome/quinol oxidase subunit 1